jgi:hypothetical protein
MTLPMNAILRSSQIRKIQHVGVVIKMVLLKYE